MKSYKKKSSLHNPPFREVFSRVLEVVGYHFLFGMPAWTAAFMLWDVLIIEGREPARYELHQIPFLAVPFSIIGALIFWPLAVCGGLLAASLRAGFGFYRWWMAVLAGILLGLAALLFHGFEAEPDGKSYWTPIVAACVAAMLASMPSTNRIMAISDA